MDTHKNNKTLPMVTTSEGAGVRIKRAIGTQHMRHLDPFLLLDYFDNHRADDYIAGFPEHPHRGFTTFTYMLDGQMEHQDSMGHIGVIGPGDAQWMKAAHGVIHSEMPKQIEGRMRGFQLWINLPAAEKRDAPAYQEFNADQFPVFQHNGHQVRLLMGQFDNHHAPIQDTTTDVSYMDIQLSNEHPLSITVPDDQQGFVLAYEHSARLDLQPLKSEHMAILTTGEHTLSTDNTSARLIVAYGKPIHEPIVQHGPFVMNSQAEIYQALQDYRDGTFTVTPSEHDA